MPDPNASSAGSPALPDGSQRVHEPTISFSVLTLLRVVGLVGTATVVLWHTGDLVQIQPHQASGFVVLVIAGVAVGLTLLVLLPFETGRLLRHKDVLIPLGLYLPAVAILGVLATNPALAAVLTPAWPLKLFAISIPLSVLFVIQLLLGVIYGGWTTALILQAVRQDQADPVGSITDIGRWFLRVLGAEFIGAAVLFACLAVALALGAASIDLALVLIGVCSLVWNLATAAFLPVVVAERGSFRSDLMRALRISWTRKGRWWLPIVIQMILLGWVVFIHVSYSGSPAPGSFTTTDKTSWQVNGFWTGGYEDTCRWHTALMNVLEAEPLPLVTTLLGLMFAVLAIVIKFRIAGGIYERMPIDNEKSSGSESGTEDVCQIASGESAGVRPAAGPDGTTTG